MAASPIAANSDDNMQMDDKWAPQTDQQPESQAPAANDAEPANGAAHPDDQPQTQQGQPAESSASPATFASGKTDVSLRGEKQIKPNKVYIGGLPEHTRKEDLESCFGKIGNISNIELKVGYGFVEFDNREAAEESVAKYHEGYFMGNKIRVELSHGGGRTAKYSNDPGACFKCGQVGHWARECPNQAGEPRRGGPPLIDRIQPPRDYLPPPPPRDYPPYDYPRYPPPRDPRYGYDYPPPPPPGRDYRRPPSPPRDYRNYPPQPPPRSSRDVDDYRMRGPPPPPPSRYDSKAGYYAEPELPPPGYPPRYPPPPPRDYYDRYDRRQPPPDRYTPYPPSGRPRSPPGQPRARDEFERPPREHPAPANYAAPDYHRGGSSDRYRRRSQSPLPRPATTAYDAGYTSNAGVPYKNNSAGFSGNGYPAGAPPSRGSSSARDYPPRSRDGDPGYRRL